jgi:lipoprotein NlpI/transglutaminase-like putative cysteine protease
MTVWSAARALAALLIVVTATTGAAAQTAPQTPPLKEIQVGAGAFSLGEPPPSWVDAIAIPASSRTDSIVIRLADTQYLVAETPTVFVHRAVMVNDAASLTNAGQIPIVFVPQYQRLHLHAIHVLRGQDTLDRTASSTVRFLQRETGLEHGIYSDAVTASILVNDLRVGDTLEYSYSLLGQNPVFGGKFVEASPWDQPYPTMLRRVVLNHPVARPITWRLLDDSGSKLLTPAEAIHDGMRKVRFEEQSLAPATAEPLAPSDYFSSRWLQFSEFTGWNEVAVWASGLFQFDGVLDDDLRAIVAKIRERPTTEERVVAALEFVQSEVRYFSVALGESSHRPTRPDIVLKRRYGDCKDKSLLLITLLHEIGIEGHPVLLQIGRRKGLDRLLPGPQLFNHAIVQAEVDGKVFYLDPTRLGQHGRLSSMGQAHEGSQVLVVAPDTRQLATISTENALDLVRSEVSETVTLSKFGDDAQLEARQVWHGEPAETIRVMIEHMPHERIVRSIGDALEARYPGSKLAGEPDIQDDRVNNVLSYTARYNVPKLATEKNGNWFVRYLPTNLKGALAAPSSATRRAPFRGFRFPFEATYTFEVKFPDEVSVATDPATETIQDKYFTYAVTSSFRGNVSKTTIDMKTLADQVEAQDIQKYSEDLQAAGNATKGVVFINKTDIKSGASAAAEKPDFVQTLRIRLQETVDKATETIGSGKLDGSDLADAYCARAVAEVSLSKSEEALRDATEALKLVPNSGAHLACRAEIYFQIGEFEKSIADYSRAITLGAVRPRNFHQRGVSKLYAGRVDEAAADFAKASNSPTYDSLVFSDMWLVATYQRLGRPAPDAVLKRAAAQPRGDWPRPALAMLTGLLAPEEMLKLLDGKTGDDRQMTLTEAYFYLGQYYLGRGDAAKAREYFEKTRQMQVLIYTEYIASAFELQLLTDSRQSEAR